MPRIAVLILLAAVPAEPALAGGRGCCFAPGPVSLREEAAGSKIILYVTAANSRRTGADGGTTDLVVNRVVKSDPAIAGKAVLHLDRFIEVPDPANPPTFLLFGDVHEGKVDFFRGELVGPAVADYLAGSLAIDPKDRGRLLKYCARYLDHHEPTAATDAFTEFSRSPDADVRAAGRGMDPDRLRRLLRSPETPPTRLGLFALLLAECGNRADTVLLRDLIDKNAQVASLDGLLSAYTVLDPAAGWAFTCEAIRDPREDFLVRYAGLRSARYFHTSRPDVLPVGERVKALALALRHSDLADLAVDDLRRWKVWSRTDEVLALADREEFDSPLVRRAVLRYAVRCPGERAAKFVAAACRADPRRVADAREFSDAEPGGK